MQNARVIILEKVHVSIYPLKKVNKYICMAHNVNENPVNLSISKQNCYEFAFLTK